MLKGDSAVRKRLQRIARPPHRKTKRGTIRRFFYDVGTPKKKKFVTLGDDEEYEQMLLLVGLRACKFSI